MVAHANKINDPAPVRGMDTRDVIEFPFEPADFRCRGKFLKSNAPAYRSALALYCTKGARFDQIGHDRILCKRRPCRSVFGRHCHARTCCRSRGNARTRRLCWANPHFSDMLSLKWGRPEKSFALLIRYHKLLIG